MHGEINFQNGLSTISTKSKDIFKSFELLNSKHYQKTVEIKRLPSKSTLQSLASSVNNKPGNSPTQTQSRKRKLVKSDWQDYLHQLKPQDKPINSNTSGESCINKTNSAPPQRDKIVADIGESAKIEISKRSYLLQKLKSNIFNSLFRTKTKIKPDGNTVGQISDLFIDEPQVPLTSLILIANDKTKYISTHELHKGIAVLKGKSYYQHNGVYYDDNNSEFQLADAKTTQTIGKRGIIESILDPESMIVPIRKDSTPECLQCISTCASQYALIEDLNTVPPSLAADAASSSLNFNSTDDSGAPYFDRFEDRIEIVVSMSNGTNEGNKIYDSSGSGENGTDQALINATTTMPTQTATIIGTYVSSPDVINSASSSIDRISHLDLSAQARPSAKSDVNLHSSGPALPFSPSSSSESYSSIMRSPEYLLTSGNGASGKEGVSSRAESC